MSRLTSAAAAAVAVSSSLDSIGVVVVVVVEEDSRFWAAVVVGVAPTESVNFDPVKAGVRRAASAAVAMHESSCDRYASASAGLLTL